MSNKDEKAERLAAALRENLKRRKVQSRATGGYVTPAKAGVSGQDCADGGSEPHSS